MPHADSGHWLSIYLDSAIDFAPPRTIDDLVAGHHQLMSELPAHLVGDVPDDCEFHGRVDMGSATGSPTAEVYTPKGDGPFPVFVHFHGGGWYTGSAALDRRFGMHIASQGFVVVNVDYALAPIHPFPIGLEDCLYAVRWTALNIANFGGDSSNIFVGGSSAGANLATEVALALHGSESRLDDRGLSEHSVRLRGLVALYGVLDMPYWVAMPGSFAGEVEVLLAAYLGPDFLEVIHDPLVNPIGNSNLSKLPPVYISCGSEDGLLASSLRMTQKLSDSDVQVTTSIVHGADHEFLKVPQLVPGAKDEMARIIDWMKGLSE